MQIKFEKWHGCHNDFIVISMNKDPFVFKSLIKSAPKLCSRQGGGVGADGVIVIETNTESKDLELHLKIINSDGSLARTCGNGIRCAARSVLMNHQRANKEPLDGIEFTLDDESKVFCQFIGEQTENPESRRPLVSVDMGMAKIDDDSGFHDNATKAVDQLKIKANHVSSCHIGNQHISIFLPGATRESILSIGPRLQVNPNWDGINVHLVEEQELSDRDQAQAKGDLGDDISERHRIYIWERGAGETQSCGSGACAVGAAILSQEMTPRDKWLAIDTPGGRLYISQPTKNDRVTLAGPAQLVFTGSLPL